MENDQGTKPKIGSARSAYSNKEHQSDLYCKIISDRIPCAGIGLPRALEPRQLGSGVW